MILISNPDSLKTFDEVLELVKGKTVLLDMWGTWCGPCRKELLSYTDSIKNHYKASELNYLYIANNDLTNEAKWRELIPYFHLTGTHILASTKLTEDIMTKMNLGGYPSYVVIKANGTYETLNGTLRDGKEDLYQMIDKALAEEK